MKNSTPPPWISIVILAIAATILTSCQSTSEPKVVIKVVEKRQDIPESLLTCRGLPPPRDWRMQDAVGVTVNELTDAWADCHGNLAGVRKLVKSQK